MEIETYKSSISIVRCLIHVDQLNKRIHVLDVNEKNTTSVTNGIDSIQNKILERHNLTGNVSDWLWVLYGTDGVVSLYDGTFTIAPNDVINPKFEEMAKRLSSK